MTQQIEFHRRNLGNGFDEHRFITPRPEHELADVTYVGADAAAAIVRWVLAYGSGIAEGAGLMFLRMQLRDLWMKVDALHPSSKDE